MNANLSMLRAILTLSAGTLPLLNITTWILLYDLSTNTEAWLNTLSPKYAVTKIRCHQNQSTISSMVSALNFNMPLFSNKPLYLHKSILLSSFQTLHHYYSIRYINMSISSKFRKENLYIFISLYFYVIFDRYWIFYLFFLEPCPSECLI